MFNLNPSETAALLTLIGTIVVANLQGIWKNKELKEQAKNNTSSRFYDDQAKELEYARTEIKEMREDLTLKDKKIFALMSVVNELKLKQTVIEKSSSN